MRATFGSASLSLDLAYLATSHVPIAENRLLHASVPVSMFASEVKVSLYLRNPPILSEESRNEFHSVPGYGKMPQPFVEIFLD